MILVTGTLAAWQRGMSTFVIQPQPFFLLKHSSRLDNVQDQSCANPYCASAVGRWVPETQYTPLSPPATRCPIGNRDTVVQLSLLSAHLDPYVCYTLCTLFPPPSLSHCWCARASAPATSRWPVVILRSSGHVHNWGLTACPRCAAAQPVSGGSRPAVLQQQVSGSGEMRGKGSATVVFAKPFPQAAILQSQELFKT